MNSRLHHTQNWPELARETNWSPAELARLCGISVRTLERYFQRNMGESPKAWLAEQRMHQAVELLRDGCSVKETALSLGYKHAHHFSRDFKRCWKQTPIALLALTKAKELPMSQIGI